MSRFVENLQKLVAYNHASSAPRPTFIVIGDGCVDTILPNMIHFGPTVDDRYTNNIQTSNVGMLGEVEGIPLIVPKYEAGDSVDYEVMGIPIAELVPERRRVLYVYNNYSFKILLETVPAKYCDIQKGPERTLVLIEGSGH